MTVKGLKDDGFSQVRLFCHSPESWTQMWVEIFGGKNKDGNDTVKVETELISTAKIGLVNHSEDEALFLRWSVTRL